MRYHVTASYGHGAMHIHGEDTISLEPQLVVKLSPRKGAALSNAVMREATKRINAWGTLVQNMELIIELHTRDNPMGAGQVCRCAVCEEARAIVKVDNE